jgi:hypothetical protein
MESASETGDSAVTRQSLVEPSMTGGGGVRCSFQDADRGPNPVNFGNETRVNFGQTVVCSGPVKSIDLRVELYFTSVEVPPAEPDRLIGIKSESSAPDSATNSADTGPVRCPPTRAGLGGYYGLTTVTVTFLSGEPLTDGVVNFRSPQLLANCGDATGTPPTTPSSPPDDPPSTDPDPTPPAVEAIPVPPTNLTLTGGKVDFAPSPGATNYQLLDGGTIVKEGTEPPLSFRRSRDCTSFQTLSVQACNASGCSTPSVPLLIGPVGCSGSPGNPRRLPD